jgi:hypothetical protein
VSHHVLCYPDILIALAVVHLENQADEVREDRRSSGLRLDGRHTLTSLRPDYRQTARELVGRREDGGVCDRCLNVRDNVRAWECIISERRNYMSTFAALPFQTERVNSALEGLIVIDYILLPTRRCRRRRSPEEGAGPIPFGKLGTLELKKRASTEARYDRVCLGNLGRESRRRCLKSLNKCRRQEVAFTAHLLHQNNNKRIDYLPCYLLNPFFLEHIPSTLRPSWLPSIVSTCLSSPQNDFQLTT